MKFSLKIILLLFLLVLLMGLNLAWGSVAISFESLFEILCGHSVDATKEAIVFQFRMPKIAAAMLAGASLSVSGLLMQTFFRNPIAGPFVLGISSGASLGVAILVMAGTYCSQFVLLASIINSTWAIILMSMIGAGLVLLLLLLVSLRVKDINTLLILGLMFGSASSAIVALIQYFSSQQDLQQYILWSMGSLNGLNWEEIYYLAFIGSLLIFACLFISKSLDALLLGDQYALSMGVSVPIIQKVILLITALLAGAVTAFCGPIAFVGIAVPHIARMLFRTHRHIIIISTSVLIGMVTLLFCQFIAQLPGSDSQLPINVITSFLGAPMVIYIVLRRKIIRT